MTALITGLMCWLWTAREDVIVSLLKGGLGPLCGFEGLLSLHGTEKAMWGDMVVAIEDLQTVLFILVKSNHRLVNFIFILFIQNLLYFQ